MTTSNTTNTTGTGEPAGAGGVRPQRPGAVTGPGADGDRGGIGGVPADGRAAARALPFPEHVVYLVDEDAEESARVVAALSEPVGAPGSDGDGGPGSAAPLAKVIRFASPHDALAALRSSRRAPSLLICDACTAQPAAAWGPGAGDGLAPLDGIGLLARARREFPDTTRVLITSPGDKAAVIRAVNDGGIFQYVEKPWSAAALVLVVRSALEHGDLVATLRRTVQEVQSNNEALSAALGQLQAAQDRLVESERMAAVGRVASGIAHEIGNQLSVLSYAELIRDRYPDDSEIRLFTAAILSARARLGGLVGEIRDFSRVHGKHPLTSSATGDGLQPAPFELSEEPVSLSVQEALSILRFDPAFRLRNVHLHWDRARDEPARARVNRDKLVQVIVNLLRNAVDATSPGGDIDVRIYADPAGTGDGRADGAQPPLVHIVVEDHGAGIPPAVRPRIFEPFFTTKGDRGTGLGLGICRSIVAQHRGQLTVESPVFALAPADGGGTRVTVSLPQAPGVP